MMRFLKIFTLLLLMIWMFGCSPISVKMDYDREADFSKYRSYRWVDQSQRTGKRRMVRNTLAEKRIKSAVEEQLAAKGLNKIEQGKADLLIAYHTGARDKIDVAHYGYHYGRRGYWRAGGVEVRRYKEGTLVIDLIDPRMKQLIWRGWATGVVGDPEKAAKMIDTGVRKIFEKYPPHK